MLKNSYTRTVDKIKAPEGAVNKMLETAKNYKDKEKVIDMKKWIKCTAAASLAIAVLTGAYIGYNALADRTKDSFVLTVNAAELVENSSLSVCMGEQKGYSIITGENGQSEYYVYLPFEVKGENIQSITYTADKGTLAVACLKNNNPVIGGELLGEGLNSAFDINFTEADSKALESQVGDINEDGKAVPSAGLSEILDRYEGKKYSSITLDYNNQMPEGSLIGLIGSGKCDAENVYLLQDDEEQLERQREIREKLIGDTVHCTVKFKDGSQQTKDIVIGTRLNKYSEEYPEDFSTLSKEQLKAKDCFDIFVTYTLK